jgi:DNA sulfur modification protein DndD
MVIEHIILENFRSYFGTQTINLGGGLTDDRNIVAVGGLNGAGKTTLKDAITFGLVGHENAFKFVKELDRKGDEKRAIERELNGLLNREAFASGVREARVTMVIRDNGGKKFAVRRTWTFDQRGAFRDEQLLVAVGGKDLMGDAADEHWEADVERQFEDFLKNHVPPQMAKFFVFDGEEIQRIARDEPEEAVRAGIGALLGFHLLDVLGQDMEDLQKQYRTEANKRSRQEEELDDLRVKEKKLDNQERELKEEQLELEERRERLKAENRRLMDELGETLGEGGKDPRELNRESEQVAVDLRDVKSRIQDLVDQRIIPALPGILVRSLASQLEAEEARAQWDEGKRTVQPQREKLLRKLFAQDAPHPEPPLVPTQTDFLQTRFRHEWDELFNPPPEGIASEVRHGYLSAEERGLVRGRCGDVLRLAAADLNRHLADLDNLERRARDLRAAIERVGDGERVARVIGEKAKVDKELGEVESLWESRKHERVAVSKDLQQIRQDVRKKADALAESGALGTRADFARRVRKAIELYKDALRPRKRNELARHIGEMYRHLARKEDVIQTIELDEVTFSPRLLDRRGKPISLDSQSAGEREIYALSLLWALGQTSRRELPVVIDTPLARLDSSHRTNIVQKYLPQAGKQVIILSTDTEIDRKYFELIEHRIAKSLRLEFDPKTERTTVHEGYFDFH